MSQCDPSKNNKHYTELKLYDFWPQYLLIFEEWARDKDLIECLINSAFDYYHKK